jgi:hypothetical protein
MKALGGQFHIPFAKINVHGATADAEYLRLLCPLLLCQDEEPLCVI